MKTCLFTLAILVGISSAIEFDKDKPVVAINATEQIFDQLTGTIYSNSLSQLSETKKIVFQNSKLDRIEDGALCSSSFEVIEFSSTHVPELTSAMFGPTCPSLKKLTCTNTFKDSSIFAEDVFKPLTNLEEISTFYASQIKRVPDLRNLTKLKKLQFAFANIANIEEDAFAGARNVEELDLRGNSFVELDGKFLKNLNKLKKLNVGACRNMTSFPWDDLVNVPELEELEMNFINVTRIEAGKLLQFCPKLRYFNFQENDISCEIVREVIMIVRAKKPDVEISNYRCAPVP